MHDAIVKCGLISIQQGKIADVCQSSDCHQSMSDNFQDKIVLTGLSVSSNSMATQCFVLQLESPRIECICPTNRVARFILFNRFSLCKTGSGFQTFGGILILKHVSSTPPPPLKKSWYWPTSRQRDASAIFGARRLLQTAIYTTDVTTLCVEKYFSRLQRVLKFEVSNIQLPRPGGGG